MKKFIGIAACCFSILYFSIPSLAASHEPLLNFYNKQNPNIQISKKVDEVYFYGIILSRTPKIIKTGKVTDIGHIKNSWIIAKVNNNIIFKAKGKTDYPIPMDYFEISQNFPLPGMDTLIACQINSKYVGYETYILTKADNGFILCSVIDDNSPQSGEIDKEAPDNTIVIPDEIFFHGLSMNQHEIFPPLMGGEYTNRLIVFDKDDHTWRLDKKGEFKKYYELLIAREQKNFDDLFKLPEDKRLGDYIDSVIRSAVIICYYEIMTNKADSECLNELDSKLPAEVKASAHSLFESIKKEITNFNPLHIKYFSSTGDEIPKQESFNKTNQTLQGTDLSIRNSVDKPSYFNTATQNLTHDSPASLRETGANGRFRITGCGSRVDTKTGLEWFVGPDVTMDFGEARAWVVSLATCGGGWAMPTISQLSSLFEKNKTAGQGFYVGGKYWPAHIDPTFADIGGGSWVWSKDTINTGLTKAYNFNQGTETRAEKRSKKLATRAFAVRTARQ